MTLPGTLRLVLLASFVATHPAAAQPGDGAAAYAAGHQALAGGDTTAALSWFQEAARLLPEEATPAFNVAVLLTLRGEQASAARWYETALANLARPQTLAGEIGELRALALAGLLNSGAARFTAGQLEEAERLFAMVTRHDPLNRDAWYNQSLALYRLRRWNELVPAATRVVELDPLNYNAWILLFNAHKGIAEAPADPQVQAAARARALQTLERADGLPVQVSEVTYRVAGGTVEIRGTITGGTRPAGTPVRLEFELLDAGRVVATSLVSAVAPAAGASAAFTTSASAPAATSYRYRLID